MKTLIVLFVGGLPKGIVTKLPSKHWWETSRTIEVPQTDWDDDKVRIDTIQNYL